MKMPLRDGKTQFLVFLKSPYSKLHMKMVRQIVFVKDQ